jgi:hypothetical protein
MSHIIRMYQIIRISRIKRMSHIIIIIITKMGLLTWAGVTILGVIGFAVTGPVAGSLAAVMQSSFYGGTIAAGSWFAWAQSIAMASPTP